jgi:hypothetical protein
MGLAMRHMQLNNVDKNGAGDIAVPGFEKFAAMIYVA